MTDGTARVILKRLPWPLNDLFRTYKVMIDGRYVGAIRRRQSKTFELPAGPHEIHLEIDWCRSRALPLDLSPGEELRLICKAKPLGSGMRAFTDKEDYMTLEVAGGGA